MTKTVSRLETILLVGLVTYIAGAFALVAGLRALDSALSAGALDLDDCEES